MSLLYVLSMVSGLKLSRSVGSSFLCRSTVMLFVNPGGGEVPVLEDVICDVKYEFGG